MICLNRLRVFTAKKKYIVVNHEKLTYYTVKYNYTVSIFFSIKAKNHVEAGIPESKIA